MTKYQIASLFLFVAACGDNLITSEPEPDAPRPDSAPGPDAPGTSARAVVVAGDFQAGAPGVLSVLDVTARTVMQNAAQAGAISSDPMVRKIGGSLYVVNRFNANNLTILDAGTFAVQQQVSTGAGSNPQDVAVVGSKAYLPALGTAGVVVVTRGSSTTTTIAIDNIDPDDVPDCVSAIAVGTDVYVACGILDANFSARGPGKIVVIDSTTDTVRATVDLMYANPLGVFEQLPNGELVITTVPVFGSNATGCLERVVPGATPTAGSCLITNADLGGYVARASVQVGEGASLLWLAVAVAFPDAVLRGYDLQTSTLWSGAVSPPTQIIGDVVACPDGSIIVADQASATNGLRVYANAVEVTTAPLGVGIAPKAVHGLECY